MNLSLNWLNDYVNVESLTVSELSAGLTMSGSKVEKHKNLSEPLEKIVIGKVLEIKKHENSDKLWICSVDVGKSEAIQIVTGAQNVFKDAIIPVVLDGGSVFNRQDGTVNKIKKGKLRGEVSDGMLCSLDELGLEKSEYPYADEDGILILNKDPDFSEIKIGMNALDFFGLNDAVIEFEITNNRPDCLSVTGLARETAATFDLELDIKEPNYIGYECNIEKEIEVIIENKRLCSRYMAGLARKVKVAPSPKWLSARLRASGVRPINNIVDVTNYVMLEYGYPLHAFDRRFIEGGCIIVRNALPDEKITLLDGNAVDLTRDALVIADRMKPIAVAGVMGGEYSGIMEDTTEVIFEAACFDGASVRTTSKKIGRRTDASSRFEKNLEPANVKIALLRTLQLVEELGAGEVSNTFVDYVNFEEEETGIDFDYNKINAILGANISKKEQSTIFEKLGFEYKDGKIYPHKSRSDIKLLCDLAEEVARIYGYNNIESTLPKLTGSVNSNANDYEKNARRLTEVLTSQGCEECVTYSFVSPKMNAVTNLFEYDIKIRNPFGEETSVMRTSLIPSMLKVISDNLKNRNAEARLFEIGRRYSKGGAEEEMLCIGLYGKNESFYTIKGIVEAVTEAFGFNVGETLERYVEKPFHPGRGAASASVVYGVDLSDNVNPALRFGEISPVVLSELDIDERIYIAEIELDYLFEEASDIKKVYKPVPKFPAISRDLSLVCLDETAFGEILTIIRENGGEFLESANFSDIFKGGNLKESEKCLSYKLTFRNSQGTLKDEEADEAIKNILSALKEKNINLRA